MRNIFQTVVFYFLLFSFLSTSQAQDNKSIDTDLAVKELLYTKYRNQVLAFNKSDFDNLFLEFFEKQNSSQIQLSKEEFYTYTIKIAIYSEKLGLLYKDKKAEATQTKNEWFARSYSDYLNSKK